MTASNPARNAGTTFRIRTARATDIPALVAVDLDAARLFADHGILAEDELSLLETDAFARLIDAGTIWMASAGDEPATS